MIVSYNGKNFEFGDVKTVKEVLERLKIIPTTVLILKNGKIVEENERITHLDNIEIVKVVSGG